jgi:hypothetical protein
MACGEMSALEFEAFLRTALGHAARHSDNGSIHFVCMHWGKIRELLAAAADLFSETKNLCVWSKTNAGMGSLTGQGTNSYLCSREEMRRTSTT